ncbi:peptidase M48 [Alphaproteobacteria bacterium]|nr:peptidase M48 [Alphaproteobacteria bacterium]
MRLIALIALLVFASPARGLPLISDAETQEAVEALAAPLAAAAGLETLHIYIVNDPSINAFATVDSTIALHSGLIMAAKTQGDLAAVIAHELGHVKAGHPLREGQLRTESLGQTLLMGAAAVAAGVASGNPSVAVAGVMMGGHVGAANAMAYRRGQESSADIIAVDLLRKTGIAPSHMLRVMEGIALSGRLEGAPRSSAPFYATHPTTQSRLAYARQFADGGDKLYLPPARFARMQAKLRAFLLPVEQLAGASDPYVRAIGAYRVQDFGKAYKGLDALIAAAPRDAYLYELKGEMLLDQGRAADALAAYRKALHLKPDRLLLATGLARAAVAADSGLDEAIAALEAMAPLHAERPELWAALGAAYAKAGKPQAYAAACRAELASLGGDAKQAEKLALDAAGGLPENNFLRRRMEDLRKTEKGIR